MPLSLLLSPLKISIKRLALAYVTIVSIIHKDLGLKKKMGAQGFVKGVDRRKWRPQQHS
jgi:lipoate synthase